MKIPFTYYVALVVVSLGVTPKSFAQTTNGQGSGSQGVTMWHLNGNNANPGSFLGTNNSFDLVLKSGNNEVLRINPLLETRFKGFLFLENEIDPQNHDGKFIKVGADGRLVSVEKSGLLETIYGSSSCAVIGDNQFGTAYASPIWQSIPVSSQYGYLVTGVDCPARVGIGTATPTQQLHVVGNSYLTGIAGIGVAPNTSTQINAVTNRKIGLKIDHNYLLTNGYIFQGTTHSGSTIGFGLFNETYNKDVFAVYGNGRIEVSNATGKILQLEENGMLRSRKVRVDTEVWPDYVFSDEYQLRGLDELEKFIEENKHLPNVPDQQTMTEEGIDLAEMNVLLMEKVEELTLYLIEQNKKIEEMKGELDSLIIQVNESSNN